MISMENKILTKIQKIANDSDYEVVYTYGNEPNSKVLYFQKSSNFYSILVLELKFNDNNQSLTYRDLNCAFSEEKEMAAYVKYEEIEAIFDKIKTIIKEREKSLEVKE